MRKITQQAIAAFYNVSLTAPDSKQRHIVWAKDNTQVRQTLHQAQGYIAELWLHGNLIAKRSLNGLEINPQGSLTMTTKERLNGLRNIYIKQIGGIWAWSIDGQPSPPYVKLDCNHWTLVCSNPN